MSKLNLLFFIFALIALSTASVERNLRFLGEEEERELDGGGSSETGSDTSSPAGTTPQTTTKTETPATITESTTTTASSSGDSTTTSSSDASDTTTPSTGNPDDGTVPTVSPGTFRCYVKSPPEYSNVTGFKVETLLCDIPEETTTSETTTTPAETTTGAAARMLAEGEQKVTVTIKGISGVNCTADSKATEGKATELKCNNGTNNGFTVKDDNKFTAVYSGNQSVVYLGCKLGDSVVVPVGEKASDDECPDPLIGDAYNTTCKFDITKIGSGNEYELNTTELNCNCPGEFTYNNKKFTFKEAELANGQNVIGSLYNVEKKCKKGGDLIVKCTSTGWEHISGGDTCNDDGAISSTVSSILLGVIMILAIVF